jgi:3,4-dihydroxy 2-butanone 4-phosphate synthase/GTP cyclohydrolase II
MTTPAAEKRSIALVQKAIADIRRGKMVVLVDDEDRENEGDLVMAAAKVTPQAINFMVREGRGLVCLTLTEAQVKRLNLPLMVSDDGSPRQTAFTVSIEAAKGVTTGISAADRAHTIRTAIRPDCTPDELTRPGHVFPLRARNGGVLVRPGHTEASVDLARLAGLEPAGVICEIMNDDGTMARRPQLERFARKHRLTLLAIDDLITYRLVHERIVQRVGEALVHREPFGEFTAYAYTTHGDDAVHIALVYGDIDPTKPVLTRVHRATLLGDLLDHVTGQGSLRESFQRIVKEGSGVIVLLQRHRTSHALSLKPPSNELQVIGREGQSRLREFGLGAQILRDLGVKKLRMLTNTPNRIVGVERYGLEVVEQVRLSEAPKRSGRRGRSSVG